MSSLKIDWCSHAAAKYACENWHYSGSVPTPPVVHIGVWENEKFIGVVLFSRGASTDLGTPYGLKMTQVCELTRVALTKHAAPVSQIVSIAIRFLKKSNPGLRLIVSFADPVQGHLGGIYQAGNWLYCGRTAAGYVFIDKSGRKWHPRQVSAVGVQSQYGTMRRVPKTSDCTKIATPGKYRYLMPLDSEMRKQIEPLAKPYPKRVGSDTGDTVAVQATKGGLTPTPTLQKSAVTS